MNSNQMQVCTPGLNILEEMGVLKELVDNNEAHFADSGGFVSPSGLTYIGALLSLVSIGMYKLASYLRALFPGRDF
jgi:hypothetical protein